MLVRPMDILDLFPVRKTRQQKQAFRDAVQSYAEKLGYSVAVEKGSFGCRNLIIGNPETAKYLVAAHYDTPARLPFPNFLTPCHFLGFLLCQMSQWLFVLSVALILTLVSALILGEAWIVPMAYASSFGTVGLMLFGPANPHNANDNTSGVVTLLEIARTMPENQRHKACFVLFDLEEAGLIGSSSYRRKHKKASNNQLVLNLDCVGDGDHLMMFPTKQLRKNRKKLTSLYKACGYFGKKSVLVWEKGFAAYPSDQRHFPYGVGICALNQRKKLLYLSRIHTHKDTILEETNVNILRAALTTFICCDEVN